MELDERIIRHVPLFRAALRRTLIANVKMDADRGDRLVAEWLADLVAFGGPYIANPDLVERLRTGAPLAEIDWMTVYASGSLRKARRQG